MPIDARRPLAPLRSVVAGALLCCCLAAAVAHAFRAVSGSTSRHTALPRAHGARVAAVLDALPVAGEDVDVFGVGVPIVGYLTDARTMTTTYEQGMADPSRRAEADSAFLEYVFAQQVVAPRILCMPGTPLFEKARLVLGNYRAASEVPDLGARGYQRLADADNGVVVWRKP